MNEPEETPTDAAQPPSAEIVAHGERDERTTQLQRELDDEREARVRVEKEAAYLQDENRQLKDALKPKPNTAAPTEARRWMFYAAKP